MGKILFCFEIKMKLDHLTYCLCGCKSLVPVALFALGFLCSIRSNNRRILNVKMSSEVGNIVRLGKDCQKKSKSEIPHFFLSSNFMIFTYIFDMSAASKSPEKITYTDFDCPRPQTSNTKKHPCSVCYVTKFNDEHVSTIMFLF